MFLILKFLCEATECGQLMALKRQFKLLQTYLALWGPLSSIVCTSSKQISRNWGNCSFYVQVYCFSISAQQRNFFVRLLTCLFNLRLFNLLQTKKVNVSLGKARLSADLRKISRCTLVERAAEIEPSLIINNFSSSYQISVTFHV